MGRRVKPGDRLGISAVEYNRILAAAETIARDRLEGGGGPRTHLRTASTVRVHHLSEDTVDIGEIVGFEEPLGDPDIGPPELARFVRDATIQCRKPRGQDHIGRFGVAIEPIAETKTGRVVFDGVVAAKVRVVETWHQYVDVDPDGGFILRSTPNGSAQILWRRNSNETGIQWAVLRLGKIANRIFFVEIPTDGISGRVGTVLGSATCGLFQLSNAGILEPMLDGNLDPVEVLARNTSPQPIRGHIEPNGSRHYEVVHFDRADNWILSPAKQTLLCKPIAKIRSKAWGFARELRYIDGQWSSIGPKITVYNLCDYSLLTSQHVAAHFHEDPHSYIALGPRCCEQSNSSSGTSDSSSPSESQSESRQSESESDSDRGSDKSTAIVPATFTRDGYTALFTEECPEVRFDDVVLVTMTGHAIEVPIDPQFIEVCEANLIEVCAAQPDQPVIVGARVVRDRIRITLSEPVTEPLRIVVRLTAIRRGFAGMRFPNRTREQFHANEQFLQSAYPGAGQ
jgi:hypothetical protein